jgi:hypothetical protein
LAGACDCCQGLDFLVYFRLWFGNDECDEEYLSTYSMEISDEDGL